MPEDDPRIERELAGRIDTLVSEVLGDWQSEGGSGHITFPEKVVYPSKTVVSGLEKGIAAGAFQNAFTGGEICLAVSMKNFPENVLTKTTHARPDKKAGGYVIYTVFAPNFDSGCQQRGLSPKSVVQNAMIDALWKDAQVSARGLKRAKSGYPGKVGVLYPRSQTTQ